MGRNPRVNKETVILFFESSAASCRVTFKEAGRAKNLNMADSQKKEKLERDQRAVRRSLAKETEEEISAKKKEEISAKSPKRARLDLFDRVGPSASIRDILFASFTKPPTTSSENMEVDDSPSDTDLFNHAKDLFNNTTDVLANTSVEERKVMSLDQEVLSQPDKEVMHQPDKEEQETFKEIFKDDLITDLNDTANSSSRKKKKAFLSPSLVWLEEEGLAAAERMKKKEMGVVDDFIITSPEAKKEVMSRALSMWRSLSTVEKGAWRKVALEKAENMTLEKNEEEAQEEM